MYESSFSIRRSRVATECSSAFSSEILCNIIKGLPSSSLNIIYKNKKKKDDPHENVYITWMPTAEGIYKF